MSDGFLVTVAFMLTLSLFWTFIKIKVREGKPPLVNQQRIVYCFKCDLCNAGYVAYMYTC